MGAGNLLNNNSQSDLDEARLARQNRMNQPEFAPNQGDDGMFDEDNDLFGDSDIFGESGMDSSTTQSSLDFGNTGGGMMGTFDNSMFGGNSNPTMGQQGMQNQPKSTEDRVFDAVAAGGKGTISFFKDLTQSFRGLTPKFWARWGSTTFITSAVVSLIGLILMLFKFGDIGFNMLVGGILSAGTGALLLMINIDEARNLDSDYTDMPNQANNTASFTDGQQSDAFPQQDDFGFDNADDTDSADDYDDWGDDDFFSSSDNENFEDTASSESDDAFFNDLDSIVAEPQASQTVSIDDALSNLFVPDKGMYTRQYLYDTFTKVLMNITPDFATVKKIDESSDIFIQWELSLRDACSATGVKEEALPNLSTLEENLFTIKLSFERPVGLKADAVAVELATIYAYSGGSYNSNVYAKADLIGKNCVITVFTGETAMISLRDMYNNCSDFMLDSKNYMPVVLGVNPQGGVIKFDFKKLESILITGMPRSGKSWFVQCVLTQMCAFVSPRELNIYICDPKEGISDFKAFKLPHVKKFVSGDANIVNTLRSVVKDLAPKRKKIIGDAGFVNIWDYKEKHPNVHMPVIYILIDEVVTLAERMEKEVKKEFQGLLVELISQLPALGIRAFLIPHVVKNDIIAKTATDLIPCRISVCGDAEHIESSTGTKPKDFPFKLTNKGDMAVKLPAVAPETMFIHGAALSDSNLKNNELFEYLLEVWEKLEPEEVADSVAASHEQDRDNQRALQGIQNGGLDDLDDMNLFDSPNDSFNTESTQQSFISEQSNISSNSGEFNQNVLNQGSQPQARPVQSGRPQARPIQDVASMRVTPIRTGFSEQSRPVQQNRPTSQSTPIQQNRPVSQSTFVQQSRPMSAPVHQSEPMQQNAFAGGVSSDYGMSYDENGLDRQSRARSAEQFVNTVESQDDLLDVDDLDVFDDSDEDDEEWNF